MPSRRDRSRASTPMCHTQDQSHVVNHPYIYVLSIASLICCILVCTLPPPRCLDKYIHCHRHSFSRRVRTRLSVDEPVDLRRRLQSPSNRPSRSKLRPRPQLTTDDATESEPRVLGSKSPSIPSKAARTSEWQSA